jgi:hypothetical protein
MMVSSTAVQNLYQAHSNALSKKTRRASARRIINSG